MTNGSERVNNSLRASLWQAPFQRESYKFFSITVSVCPLPLSPLSLFFVNTLTAGWETSCPLVTVTWFKVTGHRRGASKCLSLYMVCPHSSPSPALPPPLLTPQLPSLQNDQSTEDLHIIGPEDLSVITGKVWTQQYGVCLGNTERQNVFLVSRWPNGSLSSPNTVSGDYMCLSVVCCCCCSSSSISVVYQFWTFHGILILHMPKSIRYPWFLEKIMASQVMFFFPLKVLPTSIQVN